MSRYDGGPQRGSTMLPHLAWRVEAMIAGIAERRPPARGAIAQALRKVPRHWFVPSLGLVLDGDGGAAPIDRDLDPPAWWDAVYSDRPIATPLVAGGTSYTCVNPSPSSVVDVLELLDLRPGHRVLEVGTGSGWVTALLCRLAGESGRVTSVEEDAGVAEAARRNLVAAGVRPHLVTGDCAGGCPERGPYDRLLAPSAAPGPWSAQAAPGAVIVGGSGQAVRLVVAGAEDEPHRP
ncbi:protein-L-isoaspartate O-methyltransferase family protein [Nonomuraea rubra]|uniref:protein-L-isoaspartate O-methyltransferase family protein n=1 Tax=Nonomuraea rubra TaxID=46180 RepID=UPI0033C8BA47